MSLFVNKTTVLTGRVVVPGSKSHGIRAVFLSLMAQGDSILLNMLDSDDTRNAFNVCK